MDEEELVLELGVEGGGATIYRTPVASDGWKFHTHWHQPLFLIFDSETMPEWFGMPDDKDLPSTFSLEYVRAWKVK